MDSVALVWNYVVMLTFSASYADGQEGKGSTETVIFKHLDLILGIYLISFKLQGEGEGKK